MDYKAKKDYQRLTNLMLNDNEWNLLDKLIEFLISIKRTTKFLEGQKYYTLSLIFPTIQTLKFEYISDSNISILESDSDKFNHY